DQVAVAPRKCHESTIGRERRSEAIRHLPAVVPEVHQLSGSRQAIPDEHVDHPTRVVTERQIAREARERHVPAVGGNVDIPVVRKERTATLLLESAGDERLDVGLPTGKRLVDLLCLARPAVANENPETPEAWADLERREARNEIRATAQERKVPPIGRQRGFK